MTRDTHKTTDTEHLYVADNCSYHPLFTVNCSPPAPSAHLCCHLPRCLSDIAHHSFRIPSVGEAPKVFQPIDDRRRCRTGRGSRTGRRNGGRKDWCRASLFCFIQILRGTKCTAAWTQWRFSAYGGVSGVASTVHRWALKTFVSDGA